MATDDAWMEGKRPDPTALWGILGLSFSVISPIETPRTRPHASETLHFAFRGILGSECAAASLGLVAVYESVGFTSH
ncbi:MAG: hypothetical protein OEU54_09250 [Gemmatimonadota bacterium]|nr:hypothetical protein [Gemmatimonadota bacterium]